MSRFNEILDDICKNRDTETFFRELGLEDFAKKNKPKKKDLSKYMVLDKLKSYRLIETTDYSDLIPLNTYIKYLKTSDAFKDNDLKMHIHGGVLLAGGRFINGHFEKQNNTKRWTHLMLLFHPYPIGKRISFAGYGYRNVYDHDEHIFYIKISNYYLFYKYFNNDVTQDVELVIEQFDKNIVS